jgi:hypothetical protein
LQELKKLMTILGAWRQAVIFSKKSPCRIGNGGQSVFPKTPLTAVANGG